MSNNGKDLTGLDYGHLNVVKRTDSPIGESGSWWEVNCQCGTFLVLPSKYFWSKTRKQHCGCLTSTYRSEAQKRRGPSSRRKLNVTGSPVIVSVYHNYRTCAARRKHEFVLTLEEFLDIVTRNCHYCGAVPRPVRHIRKKEAAYINGVDRKNNKIGYTVTNCLPACMTCNFMKNKMSYRDFIQQTRQIYRHIEQVGYDKMFES